MSKHLIVWIFAFLSGNLAAQWADDFSDGNFKSGPTWNGDFAVFMVNPLLQLQLNAPAQSGSSYLCTLSDIAGNASWSFWAGMDFNPSSGNFARAYLVSDKADLSGPLNGYFLRIGYTGDNLCLFRQEGGEQTLIAESPKIFNASAVTARIKVTRDESGIWTILCDTTGQTNFVALASGFDNSPVPSAYFGIQCIYTSTRSNKFYFDDFEVTGQPYIDITKPRINRFTLTDDHDLELTFSEPVDSSANDVSNYLMDDNLLQSVQYDPLDYTARLTFETSFRCEQDNRLTIKNISDTSGLAMNDTSLRFRLCIPHLFDVVFNEIMADPDPPERLPDAEYLELYNRSEKDFNLKGWKLFVGANSFTFPEMAFAAGQYLIVCSQANEPELAKFGATAGLFSSSTTLLNNGAFLKLEDADGQLVSWADYDDTWYDDDFKSQGGWSLEQIDPGNPCAGKSNWKASVAGNGGTPGAQNSVYAPNPDYTLPVVEHINLPADTLIDVSFSEPMDSVQSTNINAYTISPGIGHPENCKRIDERFSVVRLSLAKPLIRNKAYFLTIAPELYDCAGNALNGELTLPMGIPSMPDSADLIINEVLFNCFTGGADYVELFNRSGKILNSRQVLIGTKNGGKVQNLCRLSETGFLIYPGTYTLVTSDIEKVKAFYHLENEKDAIALPDMPSLDDQTSTIVLLNDTMGLIDEFTYSDGMQLAILKNTDGVSLERVSPDRPANFPGNWHSAAETAGYGTPGYQNSQYLKDSVTQSYMFLSDEIFSPDNDGFHDLLQINYKFDKPGCRAQAGIFDPSGRLVRHLFTNELLGTEGSFTWDGTDDNGRICSVGMYLVFFRSVFADGTVHNDKKVCVLATRR